MRRTGHASRAVMFSRHKLKPPSGGQLVGTNHPEEGNPQCRIEGVLFDAVTEQGTLERISGAIDDGRGGTVLTANVDILRQLQTPALSHLAADAELVVADGMPVVLASRLMGRGLPERVTGSSLICSLSSQVLLRGGTVALIGGDHPEVADRAAEALQRQTGDHGTTVSYSPAHGFESDPEEMARIVQVFDRHQPDVAFIGLGFPKQERLANQLREEFPSAWFVGCGGSIAMVAGDVARAPQWAQVVGLEWLFRLAQEPRRLFRRYVVDDLPYATGLLSRALAYRWASRSGRGLVRQ